MKSGYNEKFMQRATQLSELAYTSGKGLPIGCVIVKDGQIVGEGHNEIFTRNNPTAHAEMVAIERACENSKELQLAECEMYTTLEPCPMCFGAIYWARLKTVYFANSKREASQAGFDDSFIFHQLQQTPDKQMIPMVHSQHADAMKVLMDWHAQNLPASQPWTETRE